MTKGKLINKTTGDTLTVTNVTYADAFNVCYASIVGETRYDVRSFYKKEWDFVEDKPSVYEQIQAMPIGTRFQYETTHGEKWTYIKVSDTHVWDDKREYAFKTKDGFDGLKGNVTEIGND